jgi:hypothetical protein
MHKGFAMPRHIASFILVVLLVSFLCGCAEPQLQAFRENAAGLRDQLHQESLAWEHRLQQLGPAHPLTPDTSAALARTRAAHAAAQAALEQIDLVATRATSPESPVAQTVEGLSPLIPEPVRLPLALGLALALSLARAAQLKKAMISIAQGFEKAIEEDPAFADRFRLHANTFRTIQTPTAKRAIDEITGDRLIRLPI